MKGTRNQANAAGVDWPLLLDRVFRSMRTRPIAWLLGIWLAGWALFGWQALHPASWEAVWGAVHKALSGQIGQVE